MNISELLKYGAIGLSAALAVLICYLIKEQQKLQFGIKNINKQVHNNINKFLYAFLMSSLLMSVMGYCSELAHDYMTSKNNTKELGDISNKFEKINEKYELIKDEVVDLKIKNAEYRTKLELILKEAEKPRPLFAAAAYAGPSPNPPVPVKKGQYKKAPVEEPTLKEKRIVTDDFFKENVKRIVDGKPPLEFNKWFNEENKGNAAWGKYRYEMTKWLDKNPDQMEYYDFSLRLKKDDKLK